MTRTIGKFRFLLRGPQTQQVAPLRPDQTVSHDYGIRPKTRAEGYGPLLAALGYGTGAFGKEAYGLTDGLTGYAREVFMVACDYAQRAGNIEEFTETQVALLLRATWSVLDGVETPRSVYRRLSRQAEPEDEEPLFDFCYSLGKSVHRAKPKKGDKPYALEVFYEPIAISVDEHEDALAAQRDPIPQSQLNMRGRRRRNG